VERTTAIALPAPTDLFFEQAGAGPTLFRGVSGLVELSSLPVGRSLPVRGAADSGLSLDAAVLAAQGRTISCRSADGASGPRCTLRSTPPNPPAQGKHP
jgi:hypothetical protein